MEGILSFRRDSRVGFGGACSNPLATNISFASKVLVELCLNLIFNNPFLKLFKFKTMTQQPNSFLGVEEQPVLVPTSDEKTMAILSHVLCFVVWIFGPLVIYLLKKDESSFVAAHARESLNFQLTMMIAFILLFISVIGILFIWIVGIYATIMIIVATIRASESKLYRYPFTIRFIK